MLSHANRLQLLCCAQEKAAANDLEMKLRESDAKAAVSKAEADKQLEELGQAMKQKQVGRGNIVLCGLPATHIGGQLANLHAVDQV